MSLGLEAAPLTHRTARAGVKWRRVPPDALRPAFPPGWVEAGREESPPLPPPAAALSSSFSGPGRALRPRSWRRRSALMATPVLLPCLLGHLGGLLASAAAAVPGSTAARVEVWLQPPPPAEEPQQLEGGGGEGAGYTLQGALLGRPGLERGREAQQEEEEEEEKPPQQQQPPKEEEIRGSLVLVSGGGALHCPPPQDPLPPFPQSSPISCMALSPSPRRPPPASDAPLPKGDPFLESGASPLPLNQRGS